MRDRALGRILRIAAAGGALLAVVGSVTWILVAGVGPWWDEFGAFMALLSLAFAALVFVVVTDQPRNPVVWLVAMISLLPAMRLTGRAVAAAIASDSVQVLRSSSALVPAELPTAAAAILMVVEPATVVAYMSGLTLFFLLFPDGSLPSARWRWVAWLAGIAVAFTAVTFAWGLRPWSRLPAEEMVLLDIGYAVIAVASVLSLAGLVVRFRRSNSTVRRQIKWVVWGAAIFVPTMVTSIFLAGTDLERPMVAASMVAGVVFLLALGVAVGRFRLFDVDVVISRTVVVAGLAGFITAVYAAVVGGVGLLLGAGVDAELPLSIAATVLVAIAFQPVRERMRRWANRLVYGERATPYDVLSRFSARMRDAPAAEDVLPQISRLLGQATAAETVTVWITGDGSLEPIATWPGDERVPALVSLEAEGRLPEIPGTDHLVPVEHDGELLGAVTVTMPRGEAMTVADERLVDDVASQAGLVLRNARLTADLVRTIEELRASRQRLVAAQDAERQRLERDLHDGAQQLFIAVKLKAAMARRLAQQEHGEDDRAAQLMAEVVADTDEGVAALREVAHGIYPPLLEAEGLGGALRSRAAKLPVPVSVEVDGVGRYPREVEAAVYFCVLEALQNVVKYADADHVEVTVQESDGQLQFTVADDGVGFELGEGPTGRGLSNMTDRMDAMSGSLLIRSEPGSGTTVSGHLPLTPAAAPTEAGRQERAATSTS